MNIELLNWLLILASSLVLLAVTPWARSSKAFFAGQRLQRMPNAVVLTSSLVISWLFAKSITNAANLGLSFGLLGGIAYAAYYLSFIVAGIVIYRMRTKGGFSSIHDFLGSRFGREALLLFSLLIAFRLFNEVWSNTMVIGSYFGEAGSSGYTWSIIVFTLLTLFYSLKGGMSSSLLTDLIQMVLFGLLLVVILGGIYTADLGDFSSENPGSSTGSNIFTSGVFNSSGWSMAAGGNLLFAALIQSLSYPFHDPVMTDRGFISSPKTTLKSYLWAAPIGALSIILFSFVGIYGQQRGVQGQAPVEVAKLLGPMMMLVMNFIMVTSAASTLDSTFASFSKLAVKDLNLGSSLLSNDQAIEETDQQSILYGRYAMIAVTLLGSLPIFLGAEILSATTISGTMVIGLAPVFTLWWLKPPRISFYLSVGLGIILGVLLTLGNWPTTWNFTEGKYADLLSINLVGTVFCYVVYLLPLLILKSRYE